VSSKNILLAGFSQGGAIALSGGIRHTQRLGGIIALSTYLPMAEKTDAEMSAANRATPVFMAHGNLDPTISHALGEMSREYLLKRGYSVEWHSYPMAHQVCAEEIADLKKWIGSRLG
jgi:phospholipase/carboxylesterase